MLSFKSVLPVLALLAPFVAGQASNTDIQVIEAHFQQSGLAPDLISDFKPDAILNFAYGGSDVTPGTALQQSAVGSAPTLSVVSTTGDNFNSSATYTIALVDADVVGKDQSAGQTLSADAQTRHWLVNGATLAGTGPTYTINYEGVTTITDYAGPGPAEGSGAHRYVLLLIEQPAAFAPPADLSAAGTPLGVFNVNQYIEQSKLGDIAAANYFTVENGVATSAAAATSPVNTATLSSASASASASSSGVAASASSMSSGVAASASSVRGGASSSVAGASSSASSAAAAPSGAASSLTPAGLNMSVIFGLVGVAVVTLGAGLGL